MNATAIFLDAWNILYIKLSLEQKNINVLNFLSFKKNIKCKWKKTLLYKVKRNGNYSIFSSSSAVSSISIFPRPLFDLQEFPLAFGSKTLFKGGGTFFWRCAAQSTPWKKSCFLISWIVIRSDGFRRNSSEIIFAKK